MDKSIDKYFDFFLFDVEADHIEAEAKEIKAIIATACGYLNGVQSSNIIERLTPILNKLHEAAARSRAEADKRKENIERIEDPEVKEIIKLKYVEGRTLENIADLLYCDRTTISKKVKRYCKQHLEKG